MQEQLDRYYRDLVRTVDAAEWARVRIQLAPANLHWCSDSALELIRQTSTTSGVGLHMHLLETAYQKEYARRRTGRTAVEHLDRLGLLHDRMTLGHGVWLTNPDIELLGRRETMLCHNASSNLRLQSGVAPLNRLLHQGINIALGIDEAGINDDRDMFQELRLVKNLHRVPGLDEPVPTPIEILRMATIGGALTTEFRDEIGALDAGRAADLITLDWEAIANPYLDETISPIDAVVYRGRPGAVDTVMIGGEIVYDHGQFSRIDRDEVLRELASSLKRPLSTGEVRRRAISRQLLPLVRKHYSGWETAIGEPFYAMNSRS